MTDKMLFRKEGHVGTVTFNNPERLNAVSLEMWEATAAMLASVPFIHCQQRRLGRLDGQHRTFGEDVQLCIRHHRGNLDDRIGVGLQARHLQIDPDQVVTMLHSFLAEAWLCADYGILGKLRMPRMTHSAAMTHWSNRDGR